MWHNDLSEQVENAVNQISEGKAKKLEGRTYDGTEWTVYAVGANVIRIDLKHG